MDRERKNILGRGNNKCGRQWEGAAGNSQEQHSQCTGKGRTVGVRSGGVGVCVRGETAFT